MYKLRHIPTGLFFKPSRHSYGPMNKVNLSPKGKVYNDKPSFHKRYSMGIKYVDPLRNVIVTGVAKPSDWEVVEYIVSEKLNEKPLDKITKV